jgi:hypothetical protein
LSSLQDPALDLEVKTSQEFYRLPKQINSEVLSAISDYYGNIRLARIRDYLEHPGQSDVDFLTDVYLKWVTSPEALLLKGTHTETGEIKLLGVKCSKRGNDVYNKRLDQKLSFLGDLKSEGFEFFGSADFTANKKVMSSALWVTLTFDSKLCSLDEAWMRIEKDWNSWITNLRNRYGQILALKFIQSFPGKKQGRRGAAFAYPHIHAVLLFKEAQFSVYPQLVEKNEVDDQASKEVSLRYRIHEKEALSDQGKWHSNIDVQALRTFKAISNYCRKYGQGTYNVVNGESQVNDEALLNCALGFFYHKQCYSASRDLQGELADLIEHMQLSIEHMQLSKSSGPKFQAMLDGSGAFSVWSWEAKGVRSWGELRKCGLDPPGDQFDIEDPDVFQKLVRRDYHRESWSID